MKCKINSKGETDYDISAEIEEAYDNVFKQLLDEIDHEIKLRTKYLFHNADFTININTNAVYLDDKLLDEFNDKDIPYTVGWVSKNLDIDYVVRILSIVRPPRSTTTKVKFEIRVQS